MSFRSLSLTCVAALLSVFHGETAAAEPAATLNFKVATFVDSSHEGPDRVRPYFTMGTRKVSFKQAQFTELTSSPGDLSIYLAKPGTTGQVSVAVSPFKAGPEFVENLQPYIDAGQATIPAGAENIEFKGADFALYNVSGRTGVAFDWTYTLFGRNTHRQVAYVNFKGEHQVCLTVVSDEESWSFASAVARRFMNSWYIVGSVPSVFDAQVGTAGGK